MAASGSTRLILARHSDQNLWARVPAIWLSLLVILRQRICPMQFNVASTFCYQAPQPVLKHCFEMQKLLWNPSPNMTSFFETLTLIWNANWKPSPYFETRIQYSFKTLLWSQNTNMKTQTLIKNPYLKPQTYFETWTVIWNTVVNNILKPEPKSLKLHFWNAILKLFIEIPRHLLEILDLGLTLLRVFLKNKIK